jgi:hypothetical protein
MTVVSVAGAPMVFREVARARLVFRYDARTIEQSVLAP